MPQELRVKGTVAAICISPIAGGPMQRVEEVEAIAGRGLKGDRYAEGRGSFNKHQKRNWLVRLFKAVFKLDEVSRQVTLMNYLFIEGSGFACEDTRRNIFIKGLPGEDFELMYLVGKRKRFWIGDVLLEGVKYCDPCRRPDKLAGKGGNFQETFLDRGGLVARIIIGGTVKVDSPVVPPAKGY